jgi:predicted transcriptional regulator
MSAIAHKWGDAVARRGFAQLPNYLLLINQFLDEESRLSPVELLLLVQLVGTWWKREEMPFPSVHTLAVRCGVSDRQIQRGLGSLERRELVKREKRRSKRGIIASNSYNLKPAVEFLELIAEAFPNEYPRQLEKVSFAAAKEPTEATSSEMPETGKPEPSPPATSRPKRGRVMILDE